MRFSSGGIAALPAAFCGLDIISAFCFVSSGCIFLLISKPIGTDANPLNENIRHSAVYDSFRQRIISGFLHMGEPYFPAASIRFLLPVTANGNVFTEDSFLKGAVPYFQEPIALFRRFACLIWNSLLFLMAITLIVSVTAPQRVPRMDGMILLKPLDSPLSRYLPETQLFRQ